MEHTETQREMVLKHLRNFRGITDNEARDLYAINRLSGRIFELRQLGHPIVDVRRECINRFGKKVRFVEYRLIKELDK